jgi:hypothetical protein
MKGVFFSQIDEIFDIESKYYPLVGCSPQQLIFIARILPNILVGRAGHVITFSQ